MLNPLWQLLVLAGVLGLCVGSFLNVVVYRVPAQLSIVRPGSACPHCKHQLSTIDMVPVVSWVVLGGTCRYCGAGVSWRYPAIEVACSALWVLIVWRFGPTWMSLAWAILGAGLIALAAIDIEHMRLPRRIIWATGLPAMAIATGAAAYQGAWSHILGAAACAAAVGGCLWLLACAHKMGKGDARLIVPLIWMVGISALYLVPSALAISCALSVIVGGAWVVIGHKGWQSKIAFGPFLAVGFVTTALLAAPVRW